MKVESRCALKRDSLEYLSSIKNIINIIVAVATIGLVLIMTKAFPKMMEMAMESSPEIFGNVGSITELAYSMFPQTVKESTGMFASQIISLYGLIVIIMSMDAIPKEIKQGKWIVPLGAGYTRKTLVTSKTVIYSIGMALPVTVSYVLYYLVGMIFLKDNYKFVDVILNSLIFGVAIMAIVSLTMLLSVAIKYSIMSAVIMFSVLFILPDILNIFKVSKYLPTYLLNHIYASSTDYRELLIPFTGLVIIEVISYILAVKRVKNISVTR